MPAHIRPAFRLLPLLIALSLGGCASLEYVENGFGGLNRRMEAVEALLNQASKQLANQNDQIKSAQQRLTAAELGTADLAVLTTAQGGRIDGLAQNLRGMQDNMAAARSRLDTQAAELAKVAAQAGRLEDKTRTLDSGLVSAANRIDGLDAGLKAMQTEQQQGAEQGKQLTARIAQLEGRVETQMAIQAEATRQAVAAASTAPALATALNRTEDLGKRLDQALAQINVVGQNTDAQAVALAKTDARLTSLDNSLSASVKRDDEQSAALKSLADKLQVAASQAQGVELRSNAQADSLTKVGQRLEKVETALTQVQQRQEAGDKRETEAVTKVDQKVDALVKVGQRLEAVETALTQTQQRQEAGDKREAEVVTKVDQKVDALSAAVTAGLGDVRKQLEMDAQRDAAQDALDKALTDRVVQLELEDNRLSAAAREALERATAAGKLAEGKLVMETVLTEEVATYKAYKATLSDAARKALDQFAAEAKAKNKNIYIEVQGHADTSGSAKLNHKLSRLRAETVQDYLIKQTGLPVHRVGAVAYGDTRPLADNGSPEGRAKNRRVVLLVLQ